MTYYKLLGKEIVKCDLFEWSLYFESTDRHVGNSYYTDVHISTVFLGLDSSFGRGEPVLFETMIFGGELDEFQCKYCTYEEAEKGHSIVVGAFKETVITKIFSTFLKLIIGLFVVTITLLSLVLWI